VCRSLLVEAICNDCGKVEEGGSGGMARAKPVLVRRRRDTRSDGREDQRFEDFDTWTEK